MARLRIPGGVVKTFQLRELGRIAEELTSGYVQITHTREFSGCASSSRKDAPEFLRRVQGTGLRAIPAARGADNIRNLTLANPTAGIDPVELIDVMPFIHDLGQPITQ